MAPSDHGEHVSPDAGGQGIDAWLFGQRRRQLQAGGVARVGDDCNAVVEAVLACPLGETADHIDGFAADFPAFEFVLADGADRPGGEDAPFAFGDVGDGGGLAVDDGGDGADAEGGFHLKNVAAHGAFQVVDVLRRGEHVEVEAGAAFAIDIDGVALVEVDAPGDEVGFPAQALIAGGELHGGARGIRAAEALDGRLIAIGDGHDARLGGGEIDLEDELVELAVAIEIVGLGGEFGGLEEARVIGERGGIGGHNDGVGGIEGRVDALELRHRQDDVLGARNGDGIGDGELDALDTRCGVERRGGQGEEEGIARELHLSALIIVRGFGGGGTG